MERLQVSTPCRATKWSLSIIVFLTKKSLHLKSQFFRSAKKTFFFKRLFKEKREKEKFTVWSLPSFNETIYFTFEEVIMHSSLCAVARNCSLMYILIVWLIFPQKNKHKAILFAQLNKIENAIEGFILIFFLMALNWAIFSAVECDLFVFLVLLRRRNVI